MDVRLLSDREVARIIGVSRSTLQKARVYGTGVPFVRLGHLVRYRVEDVERYLNKLPTRCSTSEPDE